ncbi:MAG: ferrochelatase [Actinobacteria bacterium]|nr:ferrochelatase [Actinomycetota bacterium]
MTTHGEFDDAAHDVDAILYLSFGGPEGPDEVMPFLERVTAGRGVPRERLEEVAEHYHLFGGVSPINAQNRAVIGSLEALLEVEGPDLPVYLGNRNYPPLLADTLRRMRDDGVRRAVAFATSAFSSHSGCRQYREDIVEARQQVGADAPEVLKLRIFYDHAGFIGPQATRVEVALHAIPEDRRDGARLVFTAHSVPLRMAETSAYVAQLEEACRLVVDRVPGGHEHDLVYQSRSGPPSVPWLEPDIVDHLDTLAEEGVRDAVIVPIGFVSDHLEVLFDLDVEAAAHAAGIGLNVVRAGTVGADPRYVRMIRDLIVERVSADPDRASLGELGPWHDICAPDCCRPQG